jgi:hypothetical protein
VAIPRDWLKIRLLCGVTGKYIIESFGQKDNNCVSIVLIKAAILHYGMNRIFKKRCLRGHWIITLKNGDIHAISQKDVSRLSKLNRIHFRRAVNQQDAAKLKKIRDYAELCFAVMVRSIVLNGYDGTEYVESEAVKLLTKDGMNTHHIHHLLGLKRKTSSAHYLTLKNLRQFRKKRAVLFYSDSHIAVVSHGFFDNYGTAVELNGKIPLLEKRRARGWFELAGN